MIPMTSKPRGLMFRPTSKQRNNAHYSSFFFSGQLLRQTQRRKMNPEKVATTEDTSNCTRTVSKGDSTNIHKSLEFDNSIIPFQISPCSLVGSDFIEVWRYHIGSRKIAGWSSIHSCWFISSNANSGIFDNFHDLGRIPMNTHELLWIHHINKHTHTYMYIYI